MLRGTLFLTIALSFCSVVAFAQQPTPEKKSESGKGKEDAGKTKLNGKDTTTKKMPFSSIPTPSDAIIVIVEELREAMDLFPKMVLLTPEAYRKLNEQRLALERLLANPKVSPSSCKLVGKLEGDFLLFTAEIGFATLQPKTTVMLGLKGGFLTDQGDLDGQPPNLDYTDDGYLVRVEKEGPHRLVLNLRVAASIKKTTGNTLERAAKLEMPGAAATMLSLELPRGVEELLWNDIPEKTKTPGHWEIGLGAIKLLSLNWKESTPNTGNSPLAKVDGNITVRIEDAAVNIAAELFLEDLRPFTKEWLLWLPPQAKITEVKAPNGSLRDWKLPSGGSPYYRISDVSPGKWQVSITQRTARPSAAGARIAVGPYHVLGAFQHAGTINVQIPAEVTFGQRLVFARFGKTEQIKNTETESVFHYTMPTTTEKMPKTLAFIKAPLELEWRTEKNQLETHVEHSLKLKPVLQGWEIDATTRIKATALFAPFNSLDVKLPFPRPRGISVIGTSLPSSGFPSSLPWGGIWKTYAIPTSPHEDVSIVDDNGNPLKVMPQDAAGRVRIISDRASARQLIVLIKNTFFLAAQQKRVRLELPRPLNTNDRRAGLTIEADERVELLHGLEGAEEPVPERHHFDLSWEQSPPFVEMAWRSYQREVLGHATLDITLFEHSALVKQSLQFPRESLNGDGADAKQQQVRLMIPRGVTKVKVQSGGELTSYEADRRSAWLHPSAEGQETVSVELQYDLPLVPATATNGGRSLPVLPIWPAHVSQKDVKVRVWASQSATPRLSRSGLNGAWKERSIELVEKKDHFPALVLEGYGVDLPLTLRIDEVSATHLAAFVADRALIEVRTNEDDSQLVRARFWLRKIQGAHVEVELPVALSRFRESPTFLLGNKVIVPEKKDAAERIVLLRLHPDLMTTPTILEIAFTVPADGLDRNAPWRTTLLAPVFRSEVVIGQMRWLFSAPGQLMAVTLNHKARPDWQWGVQGWLPAPEPAATRAEMDGWLLGKESTLPAELPTYSFALLSLQPETLYHLPRHGWLLGCSGIFLIMTLGAYFSPMSRLAYWILLFLLGLSALVVGIVCPALLPPLAFGLQPGVVLFAAFIGVHWLIQERYRRQLVFMPGFVRPKIGSTMMRSNSAQRPREASTIDKPNAAAEANAEEAPETPSAGS